MTVRPAEKRDARACADIYNYYITDTCISFEERVLTPEEFSERISRISSRYPFLVAEEDGSVIGYAYLDEFNARSAYRKTADLSVYVARNMTHKGAGDLLYAEIEKRAISRGITNIVSLITADNSISVAFHEKHGFKKVGELNNVGFKLSRTLSVAYYQKSLPPRSRA